VVTSFVNGEKAQLAKPHMQFIEVESSEKTRYLAEYDQVKPFSEPKSAERDVADDGLGDD